MDNATTWWRRQRGQALPLGLALILFGVLGGFVLFNTGQSATDKARLVNAADAAAYSGVQWQARALNFQAYTNRAMVANQVSMAQAVTLHSWTTYGRIMSENLSRVLSAVPFVNAIAAGVETVMGAIDQVVSPIADAMLSVIDGINTGISVSQQAMYLSSFAATPEVVKAVAEASDARFVVDTKYSVIGALDNLGHWGAFTDSVGDGEADYAHKRERAELIRESQDDFTRNRDWDFFSSYMYIAPGVKINLEREGGTELLEHEGDNGLEWEWKAKDTLSFHTRINLFFYDTRIEVPIGYGGAFANDPGDDDTIQGDTCSARRADSSDCTRMLDANETAEELIDDNVPSLSGTDSLNSMSGYNGLRAFRRLSDTTRDDSFPTMQLRVEIAMPLESVRSTGTMASVEPFAAPLVARGDILSSISIAEAYFKPPDADHWTDGDTLEFANAYSPWWTVRLAPVSGAERLAAYGLRDAGSSVPASSQTVAGASGVLAEYDASAGSGTDVALAVAERYGDQLTDGLQETIEEELENALRDAVDDILAGVARSVAASAVGGEENLSAIEDVAAYIDELEQDADTEQLEQDVATARAEIDELQAEFERVNTVLNEEFAPYFLATVQAFTRRWGSTQQRLARDANSPHTTFGVTSDSMLDDEQRVQAAEVRQARGEMMDLLAEEYARLVSETSDAVEMDERMARQLVSLLMNAYADAEGGDIDFDLFEQAGAPTAPLVDATESGDDA